VIVGDRGFIPVDIQMRTNVPHIFAIGDIVGQPMLAHKAVHESHVAAEVAGRPQGGVRCARDPERRLHRPRGRVGRRDRRRGQGERPEGQEGPVPVDRRRAARSPTAATKASPSCCSTKRPHKIVGGGIVGTHAGDMIGEIALAIEMGADEVDIGKTIHPHPTLGESIGMAAECLRRRVHRLPPVKRGDVRSPRGACGLGAPASFAWGSGMNTSRRCRRRNPRADGASASAVRRTLAAICERAHRAHARRSRTCRADDGQRPAHPPAAQRARPAASDRRVRCRAASSAVHRCCVRT
jgi:hypothetical protein